MTKRREFIRNAATAGVSAWVGTLLPRVAAAQTVGGGVLSWAGATHPGLLSKVWGIRFSNTLPWALDPTNAVLVTALNVDAAGNVPVLGVKLATNSPQVGFVMKPDTGTNNVFSVKAGQTPWPMLGPLGGKFSDGSNIPVTTSWGYGNRELEGIFVDGSGNPAGGLGVTFPARTFVVQRGSPITVNWYNNLVDAANKELPHLVGVDQTISMQTVNDATAGAAPINGVPIAIHHHGGNSAAEFDGGPDQWFTPLRKQLGPGISTLNSNSPDHLTYSYANDEEASMHWYHDHGEGVTRINAYAGLAGLYVIRDANEAALVGLNLLPTGQQEVPLVIQDKVFQANGNLAYTGDIPAFNGWNTLTPGSTKTLDTFYPIPVDPATGLPVIDPATANPPIDPTTGYYQAAGAVAAYNPNDPAAVVAGGKPTHVPEMFGDVICVNGKAWPNLKVEPRQYRLRLLNGSDSRVYNLRFGGLSFLQVGTDGGLLNLPVLLNAITIFPGERKDIVIDWSKVVANTKIVVTNDAPFPYPAGQATLATDPWATIMQIDVSKPLDATANKVTRLNPLTVLRGRAPATPLLPIMLAPPKNVVVRQIMLGEGCDEYGRIMPLLGTVADGTKSFHDAPDIFPKLGATEVWEFWNTTVDSHPIHMHLVKFRVANRQQFTCSVQAKPMANGWSGVAFTAPPTLSRLASPAPATEQGWKDTVVCPPGYVTRVVATFNKPGTYVYHCHILGHEEHDMMRWFKVQ
jgi:spore coat protein A, manganese oxidase